MCAGVGRAGGVRARVRPGAHRAAAAAAASRRGVVAGHGRCISRRMQTAPTTGSGFDEDTTRLPCLALRTDEELPWVTSFVSSLSADTAGVSRPVVPAPLASHDSVRALLRPDAVLLATSNAEALLPELTALERKVLLLVNGQRPVARIRKLAGVTTDDVQVAVALLASKGALVLGGLVPERAAPAILDDTGEWTPPVRPAAMPLARGARCAVVVSAPRRAR